ncbi:MAG: DnaK suppressor protein [Sulfurimonas sp.]|jgi:DnaK suppressor protein|uniref:TraR/DksA family transcriptional regulator n=1 Tax=Sulfurimonas sp. TaxID=2022749 RepID=UPI0039E4B46C
MNLTQRQKIKDKIYQYLEATKIEIESLKEKTKPITPDCSLGRLTRQEMIQEQQVNEHALHEAEIRFNKLKYASGKIDKKDYGICMECEEDILFERLILVPESSHCVSCKQELGL